MHLFEVMIRRSASYPAAARRGVASCILQLLSGPDDISQAPRLLETRGSAVALLTKDGEWMKTWLPLRSDLKFSNTCT